jgi:hypothetical protein
MIKALRAAEERQRARAAGADASEDQSNFGPGGIVPGDASTVSGASLAGASLAGELPPDSARYGSQRRGTLLSLVLLRRFWVPLALLGLIAGGSFLWLTWSSQSEPGSQEPVLVLETPPVLVVTQDAMPAEIPSTEVGVVGSALATLDEAFAESNREEPSREGVAEVGPVGSVAQGHDPAERPSQIMGTFEPLAPGLEPSVALESSAGPEPSAGLGLSMEPGPSLELTEAMAPSDLIPALTGVEAAMPAGSVPVSIRPEDLLASALEEWARAWSAQDVDAYLDAYSVRFEPEGNLERARWAAQRRERIVSPRFISVTTSTPDIEQVEQGYVLRFWQEYRSDRLGSARGKQLTFIEEQGRWRILREELLDQDPRGTLPPGS